MKTVRIATRKSALALAQTRWVGAQIRKAHPDVVIEEVHVVTEGDRVLDRPLAKVGGKGLFVSEVEAAIADGRADLAVHSMKDLPADLGPGLGIVCVPMREDARDILVTPEGDELDDLEAGARIGTSSVRRTSLLRGQRADLSYVMLRGNVDTRLRHLAEGKFRAIVLAYAGILRLGVGGIRFVPLAPDVFVPAIGQGALAIEARTSDSETARLLAHLEHAPTRLAITCERAFGRALGGSCATPLGAYARFEEGRFRVNAMVASLDGDRVLTASTDRTLDARTDPARIEEARAVGEELAENLVAQGGDALLAEARRSLS